MCISKCSNVDRFYSILRPGQTRKHSCGSRIASRGKKCFRKFQKHFLLSRSRFCVFNIGCVGAQTWKHLGNTEEILTLNLSPIISSFANPSSIFCRSRKNSRLIFCFLLFAHPCSIVRTLAKNCCCNNVFSFAPAFRQIKFC